MDDAESGGISDYKMDNQTDDVDEANIVKSDCTNIFVAYENKMVWLVNSGEIV